jgi:hypothetical protein
MVGVWVHYCGYQVAQVTKFCIVVPNICGSSRRNLLHVTILVRRILRQQLDFWKIGGPLVGVISNNESCDFLYKGRGFIFRWSFASWIWVDGASGTSFCLVSDFCSDNNKSSFYVSSAWLFVISQPLHPQCIKHHHHLQASCSVGGAGGSL